MTSRYISGDKAIEYIENNKQYMIENSDWKVEAIKELINNHDNDMRFKMVETKNDNYIVMYGYDYICGRFLPFSKIKFRKE